MTTFLKILIACLIFSFSAKLYSQNSYILTSEAGSKHIFPARYINGVAFVALQDITRVINNSRFDARRNELSSKNISIRCMNSSFFVACYIEGEYSSGQMTTPATYINSKLHVPAESFFINLHFLGIISKEDISEETTLSEKDSKYRNFIMKKRAPLTNRSFIKYLEAKKDIEDEKAAGTYGKTQLPSQPPSKYSLPENLIIDEKNYR